MSAKAAGGGVLAVIAVVGFLGLKSYSRYERNRARDERREAEFAQLELDCRGHAHELMDLAPDFKRVGADLHKLVDECHDEAWSQSRSSLDYRDSLLEVMIAAAAKTGFQDITQSLEKVRTQSRVAGDQWWNIRKPTR